MRISETELNIIFQHEDVEGYIGQGAPSDEYASEAAHIAAVLARLAENEITEENVTALLALEWMHSFNLSEVDIMPRSAALQRIAQAIVRGIH